MHRAACKGNFGRAEDDAFTYDDLIASIHPEGSRLHDPVSGGVSGKRQRL